jgi:hypothetical protein
MGFREETTGMMTGILTPMTIPSALAIDTTLASL